MKKPDIDDLIPYMPAVVLEEYIAGGGGIWGIKSPMVEHWLTTSNDPFVERWCDNVRRYVARAYAAAERRQKIMNEAASEYYGGNGNGQVRNRAVIDPVLKSFNQQCFKDAEAIRDTEKKEPKLFIK